jgi:hypothetical protein
MRNRDLSRQLNAIIQRNMNEDFISNCLKFLNQEKKIIRIEYSVMMIDPNEVHTNIQEMPNFEVNRFLQKAFCRIDFTIQYQRRKLPIYCE